MLITTSVDAFAQKLKRNNAQPTLLLVDDARVMRAMLQTTLEKEGYHIMVAENGEEALMTLSAHADEIDALILDREMPGIDGLEVVNQMKHNPRLLNIPVIMFTGTGSPDKIQEGINAGVYYYLVKPADAVLLKSVIDSALRERHQKRALISELNRHGAALKGMRSCQLAIRSLTEAEDAASILACCFPHPERVVSGLMELLVNAVEHGNLDVTYEEKAQLLSENRWREELDRRLALPENHQKTVEVSYQYKNGNHLAQITDAGKGFDWKRYWHINPARATASHGRGIARARLTAFDRLSYNEQGNSVTVMVTSAAAAASYAW